MTSLTKRVLIADNDQRVLKAAAFSLTQAGYDVLTADSPEQAHAVLRSEIVHVAVIDLRLKNNDLPEDTSGFRVAKEIPVEIPCIILTAYPNIDNVRIAFSHVRVKYFISKEDANHAEQLIDTINKLFANEVKINFELAIDPTFNLDRVATQISLSEIDDTIQASSLDVEQVLRRLFRDATAIEIEPLLVPERAPTITQNGSTLIRVRPSYHQSWGAPVVVKFGAHDEMRSEAQNYREIRRFLPGQRLPVLDLEDGKAFSRRIGGLRYSLINDDDSPATWEALRVFGTVFQKEKATTIVGWFDRFFRLTLGPLFADARREPIDLVQEYTSALRLTPSKLRAALAELMPETDTAPLLRLSDVRGNFPNPVLWILDNDEFRHIPPYLSRRCLCHGDLHGRNILVDNGGNFWLIDFGRVARSHILRDFTELESDIKFNLLQTDDLALLNGFEQALLATTAFEDVLSAVDFGHARLNHAYQVVAGLRRIAADVTGLHGDMREYYLALFFHTLNILRLQHIKPEQKRHALLAASLICQRLDAWPEWEYQLPAAPALVAAEPTASTTVNSPDTSSSPSPRARAVIVGVFMLVVMIVFGLGMLIISLIQPTLVTFTMGFLLLLFAIIGGFAVVGLISGTAALEALQKLVSHPLLGPSAPKPEPSQDPTKSDG